MKKQNKIIVAVAPNDDTRRELLAKMAVELGFALTPGDAKKIIRLSVDDIDLDTAYYVLALNHTFRGAVVTNQKLYEMAARGIAVIVGVRAISREYQFLCEPHYPSEFGL